MNVVKRHVMAAVVLCASGVMIGAAARPVAERVGPIMGSSVMVLVARGNDAVAGYSLEKGVWVWQTIDPAPQAAIEPYVSNDTAAFRSGGRVYAFSGALGRWETAVIGGEEPPVLFTGGAMVQFGDQTFVFSGATGGWSGVDAAVKSVIGPTPH